MSLADLFVDNLFLLLLLLLDFAAASPRFVELDDPGGSGFGAAVTMKEESTSNFFRAREGNSCVGNSGERSSRVGRTGRRRVGRKGTFGPLALFIVDELGRCRGLLLAAALRGRFLAETAL